MLKSIKNSIIFILILGSINIAFAWFTWNNLHLAEDIHVAKSILEQEIQWDKYIQKIDDLLIDISSNKNQSKLILNRVNQKLDLLLKESTFTQKEKTIYKILKYIQVSIINNLEDNNLWKQLSQIQWNTTSRKWTQEIVNISLLEDNSNNSYILWNNTYYFSPNDLAQNLFPINVYNWVNYYKEIKNYLYLIHFEWFPDFSNPIIYRSHLENNNLTGFKKTDLNFPISKLPKWWFEIFTNENFIFINDCVDQYLCNIYTSKIDNIWNIWSWWKIDKLRTGTYVINNDTLFSISNLQVITKYHIQADWNIIQEESDLFSAQGLDRYDNMTMFYDNEKIYLVLIKDNILNIYSRTLLENTISELNLISSTTLKSENKRNIRDLSNISIEKKSNKITIIFPLENTDQKLIFSDFYE